ncbi:hypothetical protein HWV62_36458 [Athelia sp. TMB]|nr:hypothetical protein HWV62_36458 [Athelia sp. TMB]
MNPGEKDTLKRINELKQEVKRLRSSFPNYQTHKRDRARKSITSLASSWDSSSASDEQESVYVSRIRSQKRRSSADSDNDYPPNSGCPDKRRRIGTPITAHKTEESEHAVDEMLTNLNNNGPLSREYRALIRILFDHKWTVPRLMAKFRRGEAMIMKVVQNRAWTKERPAPHGDDTDEDYTLEYIDEDVLRHYPQPKIRLCGRKALFSMEGDSQAQVASKPFSPATTFVSDAKPVKVENTAGSSVGNQQTRPTLRQYLAGLRPPLSSMLPALVAKGLDDAMLHAMLAQQWAPDQQERVLTMLVETGAMTAVQKVLFESGMAQFQVR